MEGFDHFFRRHPQLVENHDEEELDDIAKVVALRVAEDLSKSQVQGVKRNRVEVVQAVACRDRLSSVDVINLAGIDRADGFGEWRHFKVRVVFEVGDQDEGQEG